MAIVVLEWAIPVIGDDSDCFAARVCALQARNGVWQAWIEFVPLNGAPRFRSPHETEQPTRRAIFEWAAGLTPRALEEMLERARDQVRA